MAGLNKDQFSGLDMDKLIGEPLRAACSAQSMVAATAAKFIEDVGLEELTDTKKVRTAEFSYERLVHGANGEKNGQETLV